MGPIAHRTRIDPAIRLSRRGGTVGVWLLLILAAFGASAPARANTAPTEAAVKAAYLFRFLGYVEWPVEMLPEPGAAIVVGVIGADGVAAALPAIVAGRTVEGRPVHVRTLRETDTPDGVHAVFVGRGVALAKVVERLRGRPVLVVTDGGLEPGSMLSFVNHDGRVRFEAAPAAAERARLKLSARLLAVAERVER